MALIDRTAAGTVGAGTPEVLHYLTGALGSVVALTDAAGAVVERYDYDPYGKTYIQTPGGTARDRSAYGNPFLWTGQRYDAAVGLYHFWARTYSPELGRWLQRDPLGYVDGVVGLYEYVQSGPLSGTDPSGLIVVVVPSGRRRCSQEDIDATMEMLWHIYWSDTEAGAELRAMDDDPNQTYTITVGKFAGGVQSTFPSYQQGNARTSFNPNAQGTSSNGAPVIPEGSLAHEIHHAYGYMYGTEPALPENGGDAKTSELSATRVENQYLYSQTYDFSILQPYYAPHPEYGPVPPFWEPYPSPPRTQPAK